MSARPCVSSIQPPGWLYLVHVPGMIWVVTDSLGAQFLRGDLDLPCPNCEYPFWVTGVDVVAQVIVLCPCCRGRVRLVDSDGSMQNAAQVVEQAINEALRGLFE